MALAEKFARMALQLDNSIPPARNALATIYLFKKQHDDAIAEVKKALDHYPNGADTNFDMGYYLHYAGIPVLVAEFQEFIGYAPDHGYQEKPVGEPREELPTRYH